MQFRKWAIVIVLLIAALACVDTTPEVNVAGEGEAAAEVPDPTATGAPLGASRSNPAPLGSEVTIGNMTFTVTDVARPADEIVTGGNMFNTEAEEGQEYVMVDLTVTCEKDQDDTCLIGPAMDLAVLGSAGVARDAAWMVSGVDGQLEQTEFYGGATVSGKLFFIVGADETNLVLRYESLFGTDTAFMALE